MEKVDIINYCESLRVGDKIKFQSEKQRYIIQAKSDKYIICTKPFNARKTYFYSIIDLNRMVRGRINSIFGLTYDVNNPEGAENLIKDLEQKICEVSWRHCIPLDVDILK